MQTFCCTLFFKDQRCKSRCRIRSCQSLVQVHLTADGMSMPCSSFPLNHVQLICHSKQWSNMVQSEILAASNWLVGQNGDHPGPQKYRPPSAREVLENAAHGWCDQTSCVVWSMGFLAAKRSRCQHTRPPSHPRRRHPSAVWKLTWSPCLRKASSWTHGPHGFQGCSQPSSSCLRVHLRLILLFGQIKEF